MTAKYEEKIRLAQIDDSLRGSGVFFISWACFWILIGTLFALTASIKLQFPEFLANYEWLTFGRVRAAHLDAVVFGWVNNGIFAIGLWVMARLCKSPVRHKGMLYMAGLFWNIALLMGITGIFLGHGSAVEWLEMPLYVTPLLAISYVLIGAWGVLAFYYRRSDHVYVSQWYMLAALFWFPWIYTIVQMLLFFSPMQGVMKSVTHWWFAHNVLGLWMTPMSVAIIYYILPKVLGKPIHSYYLSVVGFWALALFYNWAGMHHLIGGPIPVWMISAGIVGSLMMFVPVVVTAINHHMTAVGSFDVIWRSPSLRFIVFGAMNYTLSSWGGSLMALREVNEVTHFTHFTVGHAHHGAYAFVTMVLFGGTYYMLPRLLGREWPSAGLIRMHWWCCALGITLMVVALSIGGWIQGLQMNNADIPFLDVVRNTLPYLHARTASGLLLLCGHVAFVVNVAWMLSGAYAHQRKGPTLFSQLPEEGGAHA